MAKPVRTPARPPHQKPGNGRWYPDPVTVGSHPYLSRAGRTRDAWKINELVATRVIGQATDEVALGCTHLTNRTELTPLYRPAASIGLPLEVMTKQSDVAVVGFKIDIED
ncbi:MULTISPECIES: hypothetical protein [unclassified Mesorhizobium]|uniref:hypothetical protein n=1 Tax=unclassified Mesorhizobium TaxID=325217 RepID=UPI00163D9FAA|nr:MULTISPECIES: hypothetical protein [unclassified Mesorhizobium]